VLAGEGRAPVLAVLAPAVQPDERMAAPKERGSWTPRPFFPANQGFLGARNGGHDAVQWTLRRRVFVGRRPCPVVAVLVVFANGRRAHCCPQRARTLDRAGFSPAAGVFMGPPDRSMIVLVEP
jgi:hypothetical protein